jgi:hypothetical protein
MKYIVKRYSLLKTFIACGELTIEEESHGTILTYRDAEIAVKTSGLDDAFTALVSLRKQLENEQNSVLAINGCRIDTAFVATANHGTYVIKNGKPSSRTIGMFEPTAEVDKLCSIKEHELAYNDWLESILAE